MSQVIEAPEEQVEEARKLVTIRRIAAIEDIVFTNADGVEETAANIVLAKVDGWQLVTQRSNNFKVGDLVIYHEIDSLLPLDHPDYSFLRKKETETHHRLRTIKLKGQISQGLVLPLTVVLPDIISRLESGTLQIELIEDECAPKYENKYDWDNLTEDEFIEAAKEVTACAFFDALEGYDLTQILGVTKYEKPIPANLAGKVRGNFPNFLRKTDEERIQNVPNFITKYADTEFYVTEKLDGSSFTAYYNPNYTNKCGEVQAFGVCSRNLDLQETEDSTFWQTARKLGLEYVLQHYYNETGQMLCIQGEMVGPGIQGNKYGLKEVDLYIFNVWDINTQSYLSFDQLKQLCCETGLKMVPVVASSVKLSEIGGMEDILNSADGQSFIGNKSAREGLVFRPIVEIHDDRHGRISFKSISNKWLLKNE
jgi:RNA ligase (TIGR02306 family)